MRDISIDEVTERLRLDNPWWTSPELRDDPIRTFKHRAYYERFARLVRDAQVRRAVILVGPRRVGKTVMVGQLIRALLADGVSGDRILYLSLDTPLYSRLSLEQVVTLFRKAHGHPPDAKLFVFFDEVQYLKDWERHLKSLVDAYANVRFVATGSAAAALKRKSNESGAGRFTDFMLPPLTFSEFLHFIGRDREPWRDVWNQLFDDEGGVPVIPPDDLERLNADFVDYLNFGGYPETVLNEAVRLESARFVRSDIIEKVLLRDLPSLYGIADIQELNQLFTTLAYNTAAEVSMEALTQKSGVAKPTVAKYLEYLEAAYLIRRVLRVDGTAKRFKRQVTFKVYLTNPSMRGALFGFVEADHEAMGALTETAVFSQYLHAPDAEMIRYARWKDGRKEREVDLVRLSRGTQEPFEIIEVKWSDGFLSRRGELDGMAALARSYPEAGVYCTTRTHAGRQTIRGIAFTLVPVALFAMIAGEAMVTWSHYFSDNQAPE